MGARKSAIRVWNITADSRYPFSNVQPSRCNQNHARWCRFTSHAVLRRRAKDAPSNLDNPEDSPLSALEATDGTVT
ncbi:hypothetical protein ZHAS_00013256 [Anopheles sinensis]|uniref:Uncharacterized protein n=1 Tax=Anopheles sinensis TaxID=74873 RepID=A0A084W516_ANOSI|nr:hypothetical protein ZHAS_00013256 [Anopheles sinensis]